MPDIQTTDVGRKLQRRYQLTGPPPTPFLGPELIPVVLVDDLTGIDILEATFERPCWAHISTGQVVGEAANHAIVNPVGSGVLATIESVVPDVESNATVLEFEFDTTVVANAFTLRGFRDSRVIGNPACGMLADTAVATASTGWQVQFNSGDPLVSITKIPLGWVLAPGTAFIMKANRNNEAIRSSWEWTERLLETG